MIDHVSIPVRELKASARFYDSLLAPLGMTRVRSEPKAAGYGETYPEFWHNERSQLKPLPADSGAHLPTHAG